MKKHEELFTEILNKSLRSPGKKNNNEPEEKNHPEEGNGPLLISPATGIGGELGKYMKIFSRLALFIGLVIALNSCMAGYIATEPSYVEYSRPVRPSQTHIWIEGNWGWNNQSHVYVQKAGYWERPRQGQTYVSGNWQSTPRGKKWSKGHWQRDNHQQGGRNR